MSGGLEFEWDEVKRRTNLEKHGIDFLDAVQIFVSDPLVFRSGQGSEARYIAVAPIRGLCWAAIYTMRADVVRIISVRRARRDERREYDAYLADRSAEGEG